MPLHEDYPILIPHGITPSGWGVFLSNHLLCPTTPCCGAATTAGSCWDCGRDIVYPASPTLFTLGYDNGTPEGWIARVTGIPEELIVVEVRS